MCEHVRKFMQEMENLPNGGGHGNERFEVTFYYGNTISFDDGWNDFPVLELNYCPVCGEKLETQEEKGE